MNQHGTLSLCCLDTRKNLLSFLTLCHTKEMRRSFNPKVGNQNQAEVRGKHFYSSTLLSQPKLISRCFSEQKNPSTCKFCRICLSLLFFAVFSEKTQRLGETEDSHINPHSMPILQNTNPTTIHSWKKNNEPDQCCILYKDR